LRFGHLARRETGEHRRNDRHHNGRCAEDFAPLVLRLFLFQFVGNFNFGSHKIFTISRAIYLKQNGSASLQNTLPRAPEKFTINA
jgi:hypothetical protein